MFIVSILFVFTAEKASAPAVNWCHSCQKNHLLSRVFPPLSSSAPSFTRRHQPGRSMAKCGRATSPQTFFLPPRLRLRGLRCARMIRWHGCASGRPANSLMRRPCAMSQARPRWGGAIVSPATNSILLWRRPAVPPIERPFPRSPATLPPCFNSCAVFFPLRVAGWVP